MESPKDNPYFTDIEQGLIKGAEKARDQLQRLHTAIESYSSHGAFYKELIYYIREIDRSLYANLKYMRKIISDRPQESQDRIVKNFLPSNKVLWKSPESCSVVKALKVLVAVDGEILGTVSKAEIGYYANYKNISKNYFTLEQAKEALEKLTRCQTII